MRESTPCCEVEPNPSQPTVDMVTSDSFHARPKKADSRSSLPSRKIAHSKSAAFTPPETTNENCRGAYSKSRAGELPSASHLSTAWDRQQLFKKRSQYFGDVFAYREPHNTAKHRVTRDSIVVVDLKINCEVGPQKWRELFLKLTFALARVEADISVRHFLSTVRDLSASGVVHSCVHLHSTGDAFRRQFGTSILLHDCGISLGNCTNKKQT